ncbi:hypothetical protein HTZ77_09930 [Nonomuraea sp. SMC257]|uniref:Uncharacterized protein n=1 Tax=Nonomuraea montanisoli TaxID=2741721 RepID=A0A7Y6M2T9_9ACTN|nr:hypothetical protein [Nonomuraea montanisoli]NUW31745.1 hypothetical protein [Nonomuraea montanisoli]
MEDGTVYLTSRPDGTVYRLPPTAYRYRTGDTAFTKVADAPAPGDESRRIHQLDADTLLGFAGSGGLWWLYLRSGASQFVDLLGAGHRPVTVVPRAPGTTRDSRHLLMLRMNAPVDRDFLLAAMAAEGVPLDAGYPPLGTMDALTRTGARRRAMPGRAERGAGAAVDAHGRARPGRGRRRGPRQGPRGLTIRRYGRSLDRCPSTMPARRGAGQNDPLVTRVNVAWSGARRG